MDKFSRLGSLKGQERIEIRTRGGSFRGEFVALSTTEVELRTNRNTREGCIVEEIAYIPIEEVCMIIHRPTLCW